VTRLTWHLGLDLNEFSFPLKFQGLPWLVNISRYGVGASFVEFVVLFRSCLCFSVCCFSFLVRQASRFFIICCCILLVSVVKLQLEFSLRARTEQSGRGMDSERSCGNDDSSIDASEPPYLNEFV
jgi:hypothetical protein